MPELRVADGQSIRAQSKKFKGQGAGDKASGLGNRDVIKPVLANPLTVPWPALPKHLQTAAFHALKQLIPDDIPAYHTARDRCHKKEKRQDRTKRAREEIKAKRDAQGVLSKDNDDAADGQTVPAATSGTLEGNTTVITGEKRPLPSSAQSADTRHANKKARTDKEPAIVSTGLGLGAAGSDTSANTSSGPDPNADADPNQPQPHPHPPNAQTPAVRPDAPASLSHLVFGINETVKALERQTDALRVRIMQLGEAVRAHEVDMGRGGSGGAVKGSKGTGTGKKGGRGTGQEEEEDEEAGGGYKRELVPTAPPGDDDDDDGDEDEDEDDGEEEEDDGASGSAVAPASDGTGMDLDTEKTQSKGQATTNSPAVVSAAAAIPAIPSSSSTAQPQIQPAPPPKRKPKSPLLAAPHPTSPNRATPLQYILLPLADLNPPTLAAHIPPYCATHNTLVYQFKHLLKVARARLPRWRLDEVFEAMDMVDVLDVGAETATATALETGTEPGETSNNGTSVSAQAQAQATNGSAQGKAHGDTHKGLLKVDEVDEIRVVPLARVQAELSQVVGLRRVACVGVRTSHPDLPTLAALLPKSVLKPPRYSLTLPFPIPSIPLLTVHGPTDDTGNGNGTGTGPHPAALESAAAATTSSALLKPNIQTKGNTIPKARAETKGGALLPHIHYAPLHVKGITTTVPADGNARKAKRMEEVRARRRERKMGREGSDSKVKTKVKGKGKIDATAKGHPAGKGVGA